MTNDAEKAAHLTEITKGLLEHLHLLTPDVAEKAAALTTALAVIVESAVGAPRASGELMALLAPQLAEWCSRAPGGTVQ